MSGANTSNNIGYDYNVLTAKAGLAVMVPWSNANRVLSWRISMKATCFAAVMKARGLKLFGMEDT